MGWITWSVLLLLLTGLPSHAATYFVDFTAGLDGNNGTSSGTAWKNLSKVNSTAFSAGDIIQFKRGESWTGELVVDSIGASGNPITYQPYSTGAAPIIQTAASHQSTGFTHSITVTGDWNIIDGFFLRNGHEAGVRLVTGADNNIIRNCEITAAGTGVWVDGNTNLITGNNAHDLTMIADINASSDYGAVGWWIGGSNNEFSYNICTNCRALSQFFGHDGGCFETYNAGNGSNIHHNWCEESNGFNEISGTVSNVTMSYNVIYNIRGSPVLCLNGSTTLSNWKFENNTVYLQTGDTAVSRLFACGGALTFTIRNNIFYSDIQVAASAPTVHTNNRYYMVNMVNGSGVGYTLGTGETTGDPLFVSPGAGNFHLQTGSAARDAGASLGYTLDYDNVSVPQNGTPDLGAFEFVVATGTPPLILRLVR
jgi:hypothetical protein